MLYSQCNFPKTFSYIRHSSWGTVPIKIENMKKLILIIALLASKVMFAQGPEYNDLRILYADGTYEKLVKASEKYTLSEKTKKDPAPYMWMARGLYKISLSGTDDEKYKNAYKDAIGVLGKSIKYDASGEIQREYAEFF